MGFFNQFILKNYFEPKARRLEKMAYEPKMAQVAALERLKQLHNKNFMAYKLNFLSATPSTMRTMKITSYDDYVGVVSDIAKNKNPLHTFGSSEVRYIAQTSGTSGKPKQIPITEAYIKSYKRFSMGMNASYFYTTGRWSELGQGRIVTLTAPSDLNQDTPSGLKTGYISGLMAAELPAFYQKKFIVPSKQVRALSVWTEKLERTTEESFAHKNIAAFAGIPPVMHKVMREILKKKNVSCLRDLWPQLNSIISGAMAVTPQQKAEFAKLIGLDVKDIFFMETYTATEGQFGHTFEPNWPGLIFNPFENFYQFLENGQGPLLQLHELEAGKKYVILITTPGGLINYRIKDWVEILSTKPLTFKVMKRDEEEISFASEKINISEIERAVDMTCKKLQIQLKDYVVWPKETYPHQLHLGLPDSDIVEGEIASIFDESLQDINPVYREQRLGEMVYGKVILTPLPTSAFSKYIDNNIGKGQFKPKRMFKTQEEFQKTYDLD